MPPALDTTTSTGPNASVTALWNACTEAGVGDVELVRDRLTARCPDLRRHLLAPVLAPRAEGDR